MNLSLETLAKQINDAHAACQATMKAGVEKAIECGKALIDAKAKVGHGGWLKWMAVNCPDVSTRTAQAYMRISRGVPLLPKSAADAHLTQRGALAILADPRDSDEMPGTMPLPKPGNELFGMVSERPKKIFAVFPYAGDERYFFVETFEFFEGDENAGGVITFTKKSIIGEMIPRVIMMALAISEFTFGRIQWLGEYPQREPHAGYYFPGYVPVWQRPGWAERTKREKAEAEAEGRLEEWYMEHPFGDN
jgi:hypothetical protein